MAKEGQGDVAKAIADTRLLLEGSVSITDDLSQFDTNLTASGSGAFESPSSRTAINNVRAIAVTADVNNVAGGTLVSHANQADTFHGYRIRVTGAGAIVCSTSKEGSIFNEVPSWLTGVVSSTLIVWSVYEDPEVLCRIRHELTVHNLDALDDDDWLVVCDILWAFKNSILGEHPNLEVWFDMTTEDAIESNASRWGEDDAEQIRRRLVDQFISNNQELATSFGISTPVPGSGSSSTPTTDASSRSMGVTDQGPAQLDSLPDQLAQLANLHQSGALSDEEFAAAKARLLEQ